VLGSSADRVTALASALTSAQEKIAQLQAGPVTREVRAAVWIRNRILLLMAFPNIPRHIAISNTDIFYYLPMHTLTPRFHFSFPLFLGIIQP
jgi:hypothetical protein